MTAELRCWADSADSIRIPVAIQLARLFDESFRIYQGGDPRGVTATEHRVVYHTGVDIEAQRGDVQGTGTGDMKLWSHNGKRLGGVSVPKANASERSPAYLKQMGNVATCVRRNSSGRYAFGIHNENMTFASHKPP